MNYFKKIIVFAKPYKKFAYLNILFNICYGIFSALSFLAIIPMLNVLFKETQPVFIKPVFATADSLKAYLENYLNYIVTTQVESQGQLAILSYLVLFIIFVFLLKNLFNYLALYFITYLRNGLLKDLRIALFDKIIVLPISYFSDKRKGDTMAKMSSDVLEVQQSFLSILELLIREPITIIFTITTMFYISVSLSIYVLVFIPLSGLVISKIGKSLKKNATIVQEEQSNFLSIIEEVLGGMKIIKTFNSENIFRNKFKLTALRFFKFSNKVLNRYNLASPLSEFLGVGIIGVILWQGGNLVMIEKTMNASSFMVYIGLAYNILVPAKSISRASYDIKKGNAAAQRIIELLNTENDITDIENPERPKSFEHDIKINNVTFAYENTPVLKDFSLEIRKGTSVAIVGPSGSGKSTIANLITRFYDVQKGSIEIDGIDIRHMSKESLRGFLGYVTQDSLLFNDTIINNILLGKPNASTQDVQDAANIANALNFVNELPEQFNTNIGNDGNKLSGGQKQRISIARAVIKNPPIMILDEATSSLDTESEKLVQQALENMMKNRTSIIIAHRLSTIQNADVIVVLQDGVIVEKGSHTELIQNNNIYKKLVDLQTI